MGMFMSRPAARPATWAPRIRSPRVPVFCESCAVTPSTGWPPASTPGGDC